jgi:hypothetical protein
LYADRRGLEEDVAEAFEYIIRMIDDEYLKWSKPKKTLKKTGK